MRFNIWATTGFAIAFIALLIDQAYKWWMLYVYDIAARGLVTITPFFDITLVWNKGISYGLFQQESATGRYVLIGIILCIAVVLVIWLMQARNYIMAVAMGLVLGGAVGNVVDRIYYGAVADFFSFHYRGFNWYVFNLADIWVVAGAALLIYDSVRNDAQRSN